jgi:serine protein kinase
MAKTNNPLLGIIDRRIDTSNFREQHWEGTFWDYLEIVADNPSVARNAFQRVYDMILSYGSETFTQFKQEVVRYRFFSDPVDGGSRRHLRARAPLMTLVDFFKSAAQGYGTERRILLLHGPVGSSKSTMARLLKKGLESYSKTDAGKVYTYSWRLPRQRDGKRRRRGVPPCRCTRSRAPHPARGRQEVLDVINEKLPRAAQSASTATSAPSAARSTPT